jgi:hypothetical protein
MNTQKVPATVPLGYSGRRCPDDVLYPGNQALIKNSAIPINDNWDRHIEDQLPAERISEEATYEQAPLFE